MRPLQKVSCFTFLFVLLSCSNALSAEHIVFYTTGEKGWESGLVKQYFEKKGFRVSVFNKTEKLERHIENVNKINNSRANMLIAFEVEIAEKDGCFVAVSDVKNVAGKFQLIEDVPGVHALNSRELAGSIASSFNVKVKELPLFFLLGVDMPGVFVKVYSKKDMVNNTFDKLYAGISTYLKRGKKDER